MDQNLLADLRESLRWALRRIETAGLGQGEHFAKADTVLARADAVTQAEPNGWQLMPLEATDEMIDAAMNRYHHSSDSAAQLFKNYHRENFRWDYHAMRKAAPCHLPVGVPDSAPDTDALHIAYEMGRADRPETLKLAMSALIDADHLAVVADSLLGALNQKAGAIEQCEVADMGDIGAPARAQAELESAEASVSEYWRAVQSAAYEYRKRAERFRVAISAPVASQEQQEN